MPKRLTLNFSLMVVWLGLSQSAALAFVPCLKPTLNEAFQMADVVFAGKVVAANQEAWRINRIRFERRSPFIHLTEDRDRYRTTFEVMMVWKGDVTASASVIHPTSLCCGCGGYSFRQGEEYIVYASWGDGELRTHSCYRNNPLSAAGEDLSAFGAGKPPSPNPPSLADLPRRLTVLFSFLALLGWAFWGLRRKYGVQKS
ncbi:MAG: hypothetical protein ACREBD_35320 [Blastocatellia bacterium]